MTNSERPPAIEVTQLTVRRSARLALRDISLTIPSGSITGLLGPSGCGKTTLMRCLVGTQIVESGTVRVLGLPAGSRELRTRVGYVTQSPSIYDDLTVTENVSYFAALYRRSGADVADAVDSVGLGTHAKQTAGRLSGGERTRASLACALVARPEVLILDEPTVGLDPVLRVDLWERFQGLAAAGTTLVVSSHVMDEAEHCDELLLMREGALLTQSTPDRLRRATGEQGLEQAFLALVRTGAGTEQIGQPS